MRLDSGDGLGGSGAADGGVPGGGSGGGGSEGGGSGGGGSEGGGESVRHQVKDAVTPRSALLVLGVLALGVLFITSYAGAFHSPKPKDVPVGVVAPAQERGKLVDGLNGLPGSPLSARATASREAAVDRIRDRKLDGALVADPRGSTDLLLVASGGGPSLSDAVRKVVTAAERAQGRDVRTVDVAPADPGDARGLSSFYLVVGWGVGGYLCAAILAVSYGARPADTRRAVIRLGVLVLYAIALGVLGAVVIGPVLGALPGSVLGLAALGALVVCAAGATTFAFQGMLGILGIGMTVLVIVIAGNPSAGGAYPYPLLPPFWREIGPALIPGAGTWTARSIAYFDGRAMTGPLLVIAAWAVGGAVLTLVFARIHQSDARRLA
ncbi:DUF3533 domain-containing protein [Streptomyces sp. NBC_01808]|uniref:DUF3533 domain-containing protein n=1 Tax=Streptomyces sp. NBC_01808 TaxID=2975947 RepID=UPI002DDC401E|nr:DUF3533 domain-containing protein [Streptomyces sp. NBC_01808]WSA38939.1 DUF3533 domain-containing protein [Streptomyces sp. NBC_01808]